jgi:hypothetical protein
MAAPKKPGLRRPAAVAASGRVVGSRSVGNEDKSPRIEPAPGTTVGGDTPPADPAPDEGLPKTPRAQAHDILKDCRGRLDTYRDEVGETLEGHVNRTFSHFEGVLGDDWSASDIIKDSVALWINCYGTVRELYDSTYRLCLPAPKDK